MAIRKSLTYYLVFKKECNEYILLDILQSSLQVIDKISKNITRIYITPDVNKFVIYKIGKKLTLNLNIHDKYIIKEMKSNRKFDLNQGIYLIRVGRNLNTNVFFKDMNEVSHYLVECDKENKKDYSIIFWNKDMKFE